MTTPSPTPPPWTSHALEWGVGSIILGILVIFTVPFGLMAAAVGLSLAQVQWTYENFENASTAANIALGVVAGLSAAAVFAAIIGLVESFSRKLPCGLAAVGMILAVLSVGATVFAFRVVEYAREDIRRHVQASRGIGPPPAAGARVIQ
jgi:hypothetical protein